jgi:ParB-like chromosome segregation protein Spo0J
MSKMIDIGDLKPDPQNVRRHTPRNVGMIEEGLREVGAARSIVIDDDDVVLAGNGVIEAAAAAGMTKVFVVDADGETIVAVRRTGLTDEQKQRLALYDNRTGDLSTWDADALAGLYEDDPALFEGLWHPDELLRDLERMTQQQNAYSPTLNPQTGDQAMTDDSDVAAAKDRMENQFSGGGKPLKPITCPHCAMEFFLADEG